MILLVDDDEALRAATREHLERAGRSVVDCGGGELALDFLARRGGEVDLLLTDYRMPGTDGLELAERALARRPDLRVLVVTSDPDERLEASALPWVAKSRPAPELLRRIDAVLAAPVSAAPRRVRGGPARLAAAAAAACLAAAFVAWWILPRPPALPDPPTAEPLRSATVGGLAPEGPAATPPAVLRWEPAAGAALYEARIEEVDGSVLWAGRTTGSELALPEDLRASLRPFVAYLWRVDARDDDGRRLAASPPTRFRIIPPLEGPTTP